ncbi:MAG: sigma-54-dependent Fis family transcriptional regulator [Planctomycetes bacterium]|nr:sigma-54-dependent Fis family transcriptional regulator [Planctomycetota bacterium]
MENPFQKIYDEAHRQWPRFPDVVVLPDGHGGWIVDRLPAWVAAWSDEAVDALAGRPLVDALDGAAEAIAPVIAAVHATGQVVRDYCLEFSDVRGRTRGILVHAERVDRYPGAAGAAVFLRLHDVTDAITVQRGTSDLAPYHGLVARSRAMAEVFRKIERYAPVDMPVVITGETGTGKELVARAIHDRSPRRQKAFVALNCSAISSDLLESELFGHERGAFTGAVRTHRGLFEQADGGTIFLDEIGEMGIATQAKLLRVLESGALARVGGEQEMTVDVRIVAATNVPLELAVGLKRFRADLYHRLSVLRIHLPPLRERPEDIPLLVDHFLTELNQKYGKQIVRLTQDAARLVEQYEWPGNVRELRNALQRVYVETDSPIIGRAAFDEWIEERKALAPGHWNLEAASALAGLVPNPFERLALPPPAAATYLPALSPPHHAKPRSLDEDDIRRAFHQAGGNATRAAELLGVHKATLYRRMKHLGLDRHALEA